MAKGWVYVISNISMPGLVKIGFSTKDPELRAKELDSTGMPTPYTVDYWALVNEPYRIEQKSHNILSQKKCNKEWFKCELWEAISAIQKACIDSSGSSPLLEEFNKENKDRVLKKELERNKEIEIKKNQSLNKSQNEQQKKSLPHSTRASIAHETPTKNGGNHALIASILISFLFLFLISGITQKSKNTNKTTNIPTPHNKAITTIDTYEVLFKSKKENISIRRKKTEGMSPIEVILSGELYETNFDSLVDGSQRILETNLGNVFIFEATAGASGGVSGGLIISKNSSGKYVLDMSSHETGDGGNFKFINLKDNNISIDLGRDSNGNRIIGILENGKINPTVYSAASM